MSLHEPSVLAINGGSSSIRFAVYDQGDPLQRVVHGKMDRVGSRDTHLQFTDSTGQQQVGPTIGATDHRSAARGLLDWLGSQPRFSGFQAVGHRVVHGMTHTDPQIVTTALLDDLRRLTPCDPEHLPLEIQLMEAIRERLPDVSQVACFDTAFHQSIPRVASILPIPRRYEAQGVRRYGFHGLSYQFLSEEIEWLEGAKAKKQKVILGHLGNGASLAAVRDGHCIDTSMGFTPTAGLVMGTRSGDLDPGLFSYLSQLDKLTAARFQQLVNHESGLLGVSETSSDMRDLLALETTDVRAAEAVALFCYQTKKWIGSYAAALGGVDTLVFAGGVGENAPVIRSRVCDGLGFLGIELDASRNTANEPVISSDTSRVAVRVIRTDEEVMIARSVRRVLAQADGALIHGK